MYSLYKILFLCCITAIHAGCGNASAPKAAKDTANPEQVALADSILWYFQQEQFDKIVRHFGNNVKRQLNREQLATVWAQLNAQAGKYARGEFYSAEKLNGVGDQIVYKCYFGSQKLYFQLALGKENQVIGIYFKP